MKWQLKRSQPMTLWEEDGDLQRMRAFFHTFEAESEGQEQIKQSVKQKALEKMASAEENEELSVNSKAGLVQRILVRLRALIGTFPRKLSISVAMLVILLILGQGAMNSSWNILPKMGNSQMSQSITAPKMADSARTKGESSPNSGALFGGISPSEGTEQKPAAMNSADTSTHKQNSLAILPVPPDQAIIPPVDAGNPRKIIQDLSLTLEVTIVNDAVNSISQEAQKLQGYVVSSQQSGLDNHSSAQLTIKIPADKLNSLRDSLSSWGKVLDQQLLTNDITNQYYDSQSRLQVLEAEEKRYLEILNQAKTVDDVLKVENALGNVRQQIEQLKGQLKLWNNQVDYSTVTLQLVTQQSQNLKVQNAWQPISWSKTWEATGDAVLKTMSTLWNALNYLVVGIGYASPYLLIGAVGWALYRVWKKKIS